MFWRRKSSSFDSLSLAQDDPEPGPERSPGRRRGVEDLEAALEQFREIASGLGANVLTEKIQIGKGS